MNTLTQNEIKQVRDLFSEYAKKNYLENVDKDNISYSYEVYTDYHGVNNIHEFVYDNATLSKDEILERLYENFYDHDYMHYDYYIKDFVSEFSDKLNKINEDLSIDFNTVNLDNEIIFLDGYIDYESVVNKVKLPINIVLENYDSFDMEFSNNNFYSIFYNIDYNSVEDIEELHEELKESSLNELLIKQNYTIKQFIEYLKDNYNDRKNILDNDKVFQSIIQEIENAQNYSALTVCKEMTFEELEELRESESITITTEDIIGYHGFINGGGSVFEIGLNNDMKYKINDINIHVDCTFGYGLSEVYGSHLAS